MKKKIIYILIATLLLSSVTFTFAEEQYKKEAETLKTLGLFMGTEKGFELEAPCDRIQGAVLFTRLMGKEKEAMKETRSIPFEDLNAVQYNWAKPYISYLYHNGLIKGIDATHFGTKQMTQNEYATLLLRALNYKDQVDFQWNESIKKLGELKILSKEELSSLEKSAEFTRGMAVLLNYRGLGGKIKNSSEETLLSKLIKDGAIDKEQVIKANDKWLTSVSGISTVPQPPVTISPGTPETPETPPEKPVEPPKETKEHKLTIAGKTVALGDTVETVAENLGEPHRIDAGIGAYEWYVYNRDYNQFMMVAIENKVVVGLCTQNTYFTWNDNVSYGSTETVNDVENVFLYRDSLEKNKVYGIFIGADYLKGEVNESNFEEARDIIEQQNFDCINAFRQMNGQTILEWDILAGKTARQHSQDMADENYFSHTNLAGKGPGERLSENGSMNQGYGENIGGRRVSAMDYADAWINSMGHRGNLLREKFHAVGIGFGMNEKSDYVYYMTQNFIIYK